MAASHSAAYDLLILALLGVPVEENDQEALSSGLVLNFRRLWLLQPISYLLIDFCQHSCDVFIGKIEAEDRFLHRLLLIDRVHYSDFLWEGGTKACELFGDFATKSMGYQRVFDLVKSLVG